MSSTTKFSTITFSEPEDWPAWFNILERTARVAHVWEYVDPDAQPARTLEKPEVVTYDDELARVNRIILEGADGATFGDATPASFQPVKRLDDAQLRLFTIRQADYKIRYARYARLHEAYVDLLAWVHQTVDPIILKLLPATADIRDMITMLQDLMGIRKNLAGGKRSCGLPQGALTGQ